MNLLSGFKFVRSFSRYSKITENGTVENNVFGLEFKVGIHLVRDV